MVRPLPEPEKEPPAPSMTPSDAWLIANVPARAKLIELHKAVAYYNWRGFWAQKRGQAHVTRYCDKLLERLQREIRSRGEAQ